MVQSCEVCLPSDVFPGTKECLNATDDPVDTLKAQLQDFTERLVDGSEGGEAGKQTFSPCNQYWLCICIDSP